MASINYNESLTHQRLLNEMGIEVQKGTDIPLGFIEYPEQFSIPPLVQWYKERELSGHTLPEPTIAVLRDNQGNERLYAITGFDVLNVKKSQGIESAKVDLLEVPDEQSLHDLRARYTYLAQPCAYRIYIDSILASIQITRQMGRGLSAEQLDAWIKERKKVWHPFSMGVERDIANYAISAPFIVDITSLSDEVIPGTLTKFQYNSALTLSDFPLTQQAVIDLFLLRNTTAGSNYSKVPLDITALQAEGFSDAQMADVVRSYIEKRRKKSIKQSGVVLSNSEKDDFARVYTENCTSLISFACQKGMTPQEAEDIVSTAFIHAWENWESFSSERGKRSSWLYKIVQNLIIDRYRGNRPDVVLDERIRYTPITTFEAGVVNEELYAAIDRLTDDQALIMRLRLDGYSFEEIALQTDRTVGAVKAIEFRAKATLSTRLKNKK